MKSCAALLSLAFAAAACTEERAEAPINTLASPTVIVPEWPEGPLADTCHSAYWPCVPRGADLNCAGSGGEGPFILGPIDVITSDPYGLDHDSDGVGCER